MSATEAPWAGRCAYFDVAHFDLLLLEGVACLGFAMVECTIDLLAPALDLLTDAVVFALLLAQLGILIVALLFQFGCVVSVEFTQFLGPCAEDFERISELGNKRPSELFMFGCAGLESA